MIANTTNRDAEIFVNGVPLCDFFNEFEDKERVIKAMEVVGVLGRYNVWAVVDGGGMSGKAGAVAVAIANGLVVHEPSVEPVLAACKLGNR